MQKPNIILFNCDDLGYGDLGCYGSLANRTPAIDKLAKEGIRFTDFYAASPLCSPSRGALMTGCYPPRIGFAKFDNEIVLKPGQGIGLNPEELTIGKVLKAGGYRTMIIGKWHCGDQPEFFPTNHGFDHFYGLPYSNDMGRQRRAYDTPMEELDEKFPPLPLISDNEIIQEQPDQKALIERYVEQAIRFIRNSSNNPFFLYFAPLQVHLPLYAPDRFVNESINGDYGACVECVDWAVSVIVNELKMRGIYDDTVVIFTSDNGSRGDHNASNHPLRGRKGTTWEGGQRVPCIITWKKRIKPGQVCSNIVTNMDFLPTFAKFAGVNIDDGKVDGIDISPVLYNEPEKKRECFFYYYTDSLEAVRFNNWKLHFCKNGEPFKALYNLEEDPGETRNVYDGFPDVVNKLTALANECRQDLGDSATNTAGKNIRKAGRVNNPKKLTKYNPDHPYIIALYDKTEEG